MMMMMMRTNYWHILQAGQKVGIFAMFSQMEESRLSHIVNIGMEGQILIEKSKGFDNFAQSNRRKRSMTTEKLII